MLFTLSDRSTKIGHILFESLRSPVKLVVIGVVVGIVMSCVAVGFVDLVLWVNDVVYIAPRSRMMIGEHFLLPILTVLVPTVGGFLSGCICLAIADKRAHGITDAIYSANTVSVKMPVRAGIFSGMAACVALSAGASVGQYGALAHLGASVGSWCSRIFRDEPYLDKIALGCGVAAAISAAFHAPFAGLVFAHEVILRNYSLRAFAPVTLAAGIGYMVASDIFGRPLLFYIEEIAVDSPHEFIYFVFIGIVGAGIAVLFMRTLLYISQLARSSNTPLPLRTAVAGLAVGIVALQVPEVLGIGRESLRFAIIEQAFSLPELSVILLAKIAVTILCLGFGMAGGVFAPALLIGILFGAIWGYGTEILFDEDRSHIVIYAICGMVAVVSPIIGAPLTCILIVFELTHNYPLATAAMVSVAFANLVSSRMFGRSLYDRDLLFRGVDMSMGRDKVILDKQDISNLISSEFSKLPADATLQIVRQTLSKDQRSEAYIVDQEENYVGTIFSFQLDELQEGDHQLLAQDVAKPETLVCNGADSVWEAMEKVSGFVGESIPVVDGRKLVGVVYESAIIKAYLESIEENRREENAA